MREVVFRRQNKEKWEQLETIFRNRKSTSSDRLADVYIEISNDLSYASTYYPESTTHEYLNHFASQLHQYIYKNKPAGKNRFVSFWKYEVPLIIKQYHPFFIYSSLTFLFFILLGAISQYTYPDFARSIMGDGYVNATLENIENGDPMAVYKGQSKFLMFYQILLNNFFVGLKTVAFGVIPILGTLYVLLQNGILVGCFLYFFIQQGVIWESFTTIFIHGTIELSCIMVLGAAGFIISRSILFPGTYTRVHSFGRGVKDAVKISIGTIPFIVLAAFFEGYVTRYTAMPDWLSVTIIAASFLLMIFYYLIYPNYINEQVHKHINHPVLEVEDIQ